MRTKIFEVIVCFLVFTASVSGFVTGETYQINNDTSQDNSYKLLEGGWLEEKDGVKILHIGGSHYEMGYQHGYLLKEECLENMRAFLSYITQIIPYDKIKNIWGVMKDYIPTCYVDELHGLADGSGVSFDDICVLYAATECIALMSCFGIAAWGNATIDGRLYHVRSWDLSFDMKDPVSGKYVQENSVLIIRKPQDGFASLNPSVAGALNGAGGINEKGIAIGAQVCWSKDQWFKGPPILIRVQQVLDYADSTEQVLDILTSNKTLGWNFIVSDGKNHAGFIVETSANYSYIGTWDNPVESNHPFWSIKDVVRRTNFYIDPVLASTQRDYYNPSGFIGLIKTFLKKEPYFVVWNSYRAMSEEIEKNWGKMDINSTISMIQRVYRGETDFVLKFIKKHATTGSFLKAWNQWAACSETGDIAVSFATNSRNACENKVHYFNLYDLLNSNPP